ncbi:uncharacterized protein BDW47DRAFT_43920 [Aspergillus candidus]|uniref:Uncharacterized protein n=1 Tax=Aspergillus candidus TaxID=41067 RepID=A0A2I2FN31_ASPCN|nr:hypothetical protein BDW47DRAFT_43920 [Aspergillus candidus]PLB42024.1 hypothetical protein BDW47DRAFT_43920 [Aspergillus candidus]
MLSTWLSLPFPFFFLHGKLRYKERKQLSTCQYGWALISTIGVIFFISSHLVFWSQPMGLAGRRYLPRFYLNISLRFISLFFSLWLDFILCYLLELCLVGLEINACRIG